MCWNFFIAVYYKASGFPWRLIRNASDWTTCFIGISFYEALDHSRLLTSLAQVFDERGPRARRSGCTSRKG